MASPSVANQPGPASIRDVETAISNTLSTQGAPYSNYSCMRVSWDDVSRGTVGNGLSCLGSNITDTYLKGKDGSGLFTVRPDNWNEKLGVVRATDIALLIGNCNNSNQELKNISLLDFLKNPCQNGADYTGIDQHINLHDAAADQTVSIRFQTVFLPVETSKNGRSTFQFATEAYNYNTKSDDDPRNLVLLATTQGLAVQADGAGQKRLLHHYRDGGVVKEFWLEAEQSGHKVGGEQKESVEEKADALKRGKAVSKVLGIKAMGSRFNTLMTVQVPLQKQKKSNRKSASKSQFTDDLEESDDSETVGLDFELEDDSVPYATNSEQIDYQESLFSAGQHPEILFHNAPPSNVLLISKRRHSKKWSSRKKVGQSNAARVSRGDFYKTYEEIKVKKPMRNTNEHVTVTVVFYNTVAGGIPSTEDVVAAIDDMETLLRACSESGRLKDAAFNFMKEKLTVDDLNEISNKLTTQPPHSVTNKLVPPFPVEDSENEEEVELLLKVVRSVKNRESLAKARLMTLGKCIVLVWAQRV